MDFLHSKWNVWFQNSLFSKILYIFNSIFLEGLSPEQLRSNHYLLFFVDDEILNDFI